MLRHCFALMITVASCPQVSLADAIESCDDLWFTRNAILHSAGYCFGSKLGRAIFGNKGCIGTQASLDAKAKRDVDEIRKWEKTHDCNVDTNSTQLDIPDLSIRRRLTDFPIPDGFAGGCTWKGPKIGLYAGRSRSSAVIGRISSGDQLGYRHLPVGKWIYVTVWDPGSNGIKDGGWLEASLDESDCRDFAG
jgi:hypothetical protein